MKRILVLTLLLLTVLLPACAPKTTEDVPPSPAAPTEHLPEEDYDYTLSDEPTDFILITTNKGEIIVQLYPDVAPITVKNFQDLTARGFYDGLTFHRIVRDFVIQGGDPEGNGTGGSGKKIKGEFALNGVKNELSHTRGVISMARRSDDLNSATSQFFIVLSDKYVSSLDGQYAGFGKVIEGMDTVDAIAAGGVSPASVMTSVRFVTVVPTGQEQAE